MTKYRGDNDNIRSHIISLRIALVILAVGCLLLWFSAERAKQVQRLYQPPDLRNGAVTQINIVPETTVYAFALNIHQLVNTWEKNGEKDYQKNIHRYGAYLTASYQEWLKGDEVTRRMAGELRNRSRAAIPANGVAYDSRRVDIIDANNWVVWLDFDINEYQKGLQVKTVRIRYPVKVVLRDISRELNPWGLQLNGFAGSPKRIAREEAVK